MRHQLARAALARPLLSLTVLACALSWALWIPMLLSARGLLPFHVPTLPFGSFGPSAAALLLAALCGGRPAVRRLLAATVRWRGAAAGAWLLALLPLAAYGGAAVGTALATGVSLAPRVEGWPWLLPLALAVLVLGGPLGEELGWRGWALPQLLAGRSPLVASLLTATAWTVWHLPLFWLDGSAQQGTALGGFAALVAGQAMLFTWLWRRSGGSLAPALLYHTSVNVCAVVAQQAVPALEAEPLFGRLLLAGFGIAAAAAALADGRRVAQSAAAPAVAVAAS